MLRAGLLLCISLFLAVSSGWTPKADPPEQAKINVPEYTADGRMLFPRNYREWVYLSTGVDMSYTANSSTDHSMFDNVFVNPESYRSFLQTGRWPDKTMMMLEQRGALTKSALNKAGHYQTTEIMGREIHVKDQARFKDTGGWAFFAFDNDEPSKMFPKEMNCYSCHQQHAAVDTTFVQFYPTLIGLARDKGTLSPAYLRDEPSAAK